ncbi:MAG: hypothetical protein IE933_08465 [Sphingomonadales bacterium]|nr:hypothetical protein [Sphingomonadales bacterium]MBD3773583.1 hypothetical protein [Paracoccaceae bacterium]
MIVTGSRLRHIGWAVVLTICFTAFTALTFRVNAVKSEVRLEERRIVALTRKKEMLETEFQTRASQIQLSEWNAVDFGYQAPRADQYLENERQLASLGTPRAPGAPTPIRVARAPREGEEGYPAMVSPLTGKPVHPGHSADAGANPLATLAGRIADEANIRSARAETIE